MEKKQFHVHLVSDSTGETVSSTARSVFALFEDTEPQEHLWSLVRTKGQMERVVEEIRDNPGIVLYTVVEEKLQQILKDSCREMGIPCVSVLTHVIQEVASYLGIKEKAKAGKQHQLTEEYFSRVEAINFALEHDDGMNTENLEQADIVLVGPSRTSKTPTCVYLSYRGYYVANVPLVKDCPLPDNLFTLKKPLVVGLIISPERLVLIRKSRLVSLNETRETDYVDMAVIKDEVADARKMYAKYEWPVIDVTRRSIEETVANIINLYNERKGKKEGV
ncbi:MAG: kinase/pyrophosphorylase [Proteobacteria bacterium]|nr:kinase/pyrophosphorylase [Pseudomonadota bacterium]